jgi:hypothetical protein
MEAKLHGQPATWLGRLATTCRVTNLTELVTPPWTPYKYPPIGGNQSNTLIL